MHRPFFSVFLFFAILLSSARLLPAEVHAKKRVVLLPFESDANRQAGKRVRDFIRDLLQNNYDYVTKKDMKDETEGDDLDFRNMDAETIKKLANQFSITAFVGAEITRSKGAFLFKTKIYSWEDGEMVASREYTFRGQPSQKQTEEMAALVLMAIEEMPEYVAPEPPKPELPVVEQVTEEKTERLDPEETTITKAPKAIVPNPVPAIQAGLNFGLLQRFLDFDPSTEPYYKTKSPSLAPSLKVAVYPMALTGDKDALGARFGFQLGVMFLPAFESYPANNENNKVGTTVMDLGLAALYRHPVGDNIHLVPRLGYALRTWSFAKKNILDVPSVTYSAMELGSDVRLNLASIAVVEAGMSFYLPMSAGDLPEGEYYGEASLFGIGFRFLFGYRLTEQLELVTFFEYNRYQFNFNGKGAREAESAADQFILFGLGARFNH